MNTIAFENFRRFTNFKPVTYKGITFLVGRNNSGKSTLVKALLLIIDYLKADKISTFSFNETNIENANIATYARAKAKNASSNYIAFELIEGNFKINLQISGANDSTAVDVVKFEIQDLVQGFKFLITPKQSSITIANSSRKRENIDSSDKSLLSELQVLEKELISAIKTIPSKTSTIFIKKNEELSLLRKKISTVKASIKKEELDGQFELQTFYTGQSLKQIFEEAILEFSSEYEMQYHEIQRGKKPKKIFEGYKSFKDDKYKIERTINEILDLQRNIENIYLGATLNKQSALFAIRDKSNVLAQAIHDYKQLGIDLDKKSEAYKFVYKWIKAEEFEIGDSFEIDMHAGEAYEVIVKSNGLNIHLADKGMGSVQSMLLILRLATIIHKKSKDQKAYTVIIEEPELNLHPAHQSKLAELFHEVNKNYKINFIIETHSEYLIRSTQLIVKENEYGTDKNPFTVIYFDRDATQWNMNYREDGKFIEEFGSGFFDETRNIVKQLI